MNLELQHYYLKWEQKASININTEINLSELLSKSFNFQNLNDLEEAYNGMWGEVFKLHMYN